MICRTISAPENLVTCTSFPPPQIGSANAPSKPKKNQKLLCETPSLCPNEKKKLFLCNTMPPQQYFFWDGLNSLPHNPDFQRPWERSLLKILWEKETRGPWWPWIAHLSHFPHKWTLHLCSFGSNLWSPVLIPRGIIWIKLTKVYKEMLHTKNLTSIPSSFREEEFWSWSSLFLCSNLWPPGWAQFRPQRNHNYE